MDIGKFDNNFFVLLLIPTSGVVFIIILFDLKEIYSQILKWTIGSRFAYTLIPWYIVNSN